MPLQHITASPSKIGDITRAALCLAGCCTTTPAADDAQATDQITEDLLRRALTRR